MLTKEQKLKIIENFRTHGTDTGSPEIQVAILTEEVKLLTGHLQAHKKDHSSRRGLLRKIAERRRLLKFLSREDMKRFEKLADRLKLNKSFIVAPVIDAHIEPTAEEIEEAA